MAEMEIAHPSVGDRTAVGFRARERAPLSSHTNWSPATDRPDPIALLAEQDTIREPDLVPVRHDRMIVSPFTFYRGAERRHVIPQRRALLRPGHDRPVHRPRQLSSGTALRRRHRLEPPAAHRDPPRGLLDDDAGVDRQYHAGDVPGLVGGQPQHRVADVR
ncbi:MAG: DUF2252 family protein, partial [Actinobacteria bacterium]|nr:DUF2252 family protein [Actinomycetota bacterium]